MGNYIAQYNSGIMADLDFFIGEEAVSQSRASGIYNLSYPIQHSKVHIYSLYFKKKIRISLSHEMTFGHSTCCYMC